MTEAADLLLTGAAVHTLADPDETYEAVAVRDGEVVRVTSAYEAGFLEGAATEVVDLDGGVVLPGFVDAHTHLDAVGRRQVDADLAGATGPGDCIERLRAVRDVHEEWVLGFGYDESEWDGGRYLTRADLNAVSEDRPVAAFREDMHLASLNSVALDRLGAEMPDDDVRTEDGDPTGVVVEDATGAVWDAIAPTPAEARDLVLAAQEYAHARGVTAVHEMVRRPAVARAYRDLDEAGRLSLRVRLNYWLDFLEAVTETGLATNHGSERVRTGAVKFMTDGSIGGRTAKLSAPYADGDGTGQWVRDPPDARAAIERIDDADLQAAVHAIGDEATAETVAAFEGTDPGARHRIEHVEVLTDELVERLGASDLVVSVQPNFLKWAREGGLYESRLGPERTAASNRVGDLLAAGATLAFGSDCMPLDPLFGVQQVVTAPAEGQRLPVTEALRAYTIGGAYAAFEEDEGGTIEPGKRADFAVLADSPWAVPDGEIAGIEVLMTVVGGEVVYDAR